MCSSHWAQLYSKCCRLSARSCRKPCKNLVKSSFFICTLAVRVKELKQFCDFVDIEYQRILQHGNTRFLSLLSALQRILEMFERLRSYFNSQEGLSYANQKLF